VAVAREGIAGRREAVVGGRDARAGGVVEVEVRQEVETGLEPQRARPFSPRLAHHERGGPVGDEEVELVVAARRVGRDPRRRVGGRRAGEQVQAEFDARKAGQLGGRAPANEYTRHEAKPEHTGTGASRGEVYAG